MTTARPRSTAGAILIVMVSASLACSSNDSPGGNAGGTSGAGGRGGSSGSGGSGGTGGTAGTGGSGGTSGTGGTGGMAGTGGSAGKDGPARDAPAADRASDARGPDSGGIRDGRADRGGGDAAVLSTLTCDSPGLVFKTANKTNYESYPAPGSQECIEFSGCKYQGMFNVCGKLVKSKPWVMSHSIAAFFPLGSMGFHNICIRSGNRRMEVTVYDTCGDMDCNGCCTENRRGADALIDLERFTNERFGVGDGRIQWADLGYKGATCND